MPRETRHRGAASLASRFGLTSPVKRALDVTMAELEVLVAVASCERTEGQPTAAAIKQITGRTGHHLISELVGRGLLENQGRTKELLAFYGTTAKCRELLGLEGVVAA